MCCVLEQSGANIWFLSKIKKVKADFRICISKSCLVSLQHVHKVYFFHISKFGCAVHNIHNDTAKFFFSIF